MKYHVAHIPANFTQPIKVVDITDNLSSMYPILDCNIVERVAMHSSYRAAMWVSEEGAIVNFSKLNLRASVIVGHEIYGDAIMAGEDTEGNITSLQISCPKIFFDMVEEECQALALELLTKDN